MHLQQQIQHEFQDFMAVHSEFQLGRLPTEQPHPLTVRLSDMAQNDLPTALQTLLKVDQSALKELLLRSPSLEKLHRAVRETLQSGGRLFLVGCGATGRLSLALESLWRFYPDREDTEKNQVISFMAGGDVALIHSIEKFEDFPEFGARQLTELGFSSNDLLIATTEGGETPFVIGATEKATSISHRKPFFLYCNPDSILCEVAARSKAVIENPKIEKINLFVGPMALTGSTRMQSTTVLMLAVGACIFHHDEDFASVTREIQDLSDFLQEPFSFLEKFIVREADIYKDQEFLFYSTDPLIGMTVLTDTTERSPTFSLFPFENQKDEHKHPSLCYLLFEKSMNAQQAWLDLLQRSPRTFHWKEVTHQTSQERLEGFDFSRQLIPARTSYTSRRHHHFVIQDLPQEFYFQLQEIEHTQSVTHLSYLGRQIYLKMVMNTMSTLIMGRLNRYQSNLMTWVRPSNNKLIDRAVRFADILLKQKGKSISYADLVRTCIELKHTLPRDLSLVQALVNKF